MASIILHRANEDVAGATDNMAVGQDRYPKWNPGKWKHALKPATFGGLILTHPHWASAFGSLNPPFERKTDAGEPPKLVEAPLLVPMPEKEAL